MNPEVEPRNPPTDKPVVHLLEVLIFLALITPSMVVDLFLFREQKASFEFVAWATMTRDIALVCLILFFLWRSGEPIRRIGWTLKHVWREIALGVVLYVPFFFATGWIARTLEAAGLSGAHEPTPSFLTAQGPAQLVLASFLVVVVAISEETMFRGYLILRFTEVTRSCAAALILSSAFFALGHGYEGSAGMATVGIMGLVFALVYLWRGSLVAPITMHFLQDFIGIVLVPWLARGH